MKKDVKVIFMLFVLISFITSCQKQLDNSNDISTIKITVTSLQKTIDSLSQIVNLNASNQIGISTKIDSFKIQISGINLQLNSLSNQIANNNLNITSINSQILIINQQITTLMTQIDALLTSINSEFVWKRKSPMPFNITQANAVTIGNIVYIIGGNNNNSAPTNSLLAYNTVNDKWTILAGFPTNRGETASEVVNGIIYVIGGYNYSGSAVSTVEAYDPKTNTWTSKASMPIARSEICSAVVNNKIYVMGGWPGAINVVQCYDPSINTWTSVTPMPVGVEQSNSAVSFGNFVYLIGGKNNATSVYYQHNLSYSVSNNSWNTKAQYPLPIFYGTALVDTTKGIIHYLGGTSIPRPFQAYSYSQTNKHYLYYVASDQWIESVPMPFSNASHVAALVNGKIYIFGGVDPDNNFLNTVYEY